MSNLTASSSQAAKNPPHHPLAAQNASTPTTSSAHLSAAAFSSPAPRGLPSPAAHRAQAGKSPFAHGGPTSSAMARVGGSAAGLAGSSMGVAGSSPAAGMLDFASEAGLGMSLGGLGALEEGVGMGISMSGMGMSGLGFVAGSLGGRDSEDERRRKLEGVLATLRKRPGRVSEEAVERLAKSYGLDCAYDSDHGVGPLMIAGETVVVEVDIKPGMPRNVSLSFPLASQALEAHAESAARILQDDLTPPPGSTSIETKLDAFAKNLEILAKLDKLSPTRDINCYEAIAGIYTSLRRLFEHEKKAAMALMDASRGNVEERAEREVMCKKSGRPRMHAGKRIGLAVEYWMDCRHITTSKPGSDRPPASRSGRAMDVDEGRPKASDDGSKIFSVRIECETSPAQLYPSFRVSDSWISSRIEKPVSESTDANDLFSTAPLLDWLEPPQTYIASDTAGQADALALDPALGKLPDVRFVAKLEPPLVVPLQTAMALLESVGVAIAQESVRATTYEGLLLRPESQRAPYPSAAASDIGSDRLVWAVDADGQARPRRHVGSLFGPEVEYGRVLDEIPFTHPRQLVRILPVLRQFACLGELLRKSFAPAPAPAPAHPASRRQRRPHGVATASSNDSTTPPRPTPPLGLADLLRPGSTRPKDGTATSTVNTNTVANTDNNNNVALDVTLSTSPLPALDLTFSLPALAPASATLHIRPNADVAVAAATFVARGAGDGDDDGAGVGMTGAHDNEPELRTLARALDVAADLDVWVEWVGRRHASGSGARKRRA
ncbi:hypothetical protein B0A49_07923 [Cryomyces minteri]|uniref:Mediator of RNA polymerase II transcription subunit 1 n=1 Tax=Cryomyces minteri TaxID=331657 RepID=A0A4U0WMZ1_9PEZI|nr:hypothetical protein B0A49_07923 [Cryomyces minteri]